jgi:hypothetical protein
MFNTIWNSLKEECGLSEMVSIIHGIKQFTEYFNQDYFADKDAKNAAIDAICQILQEHKDK